MAFLPPGRQTVSERQRESFAEKWGKGDAFDVRGVATLGGLRRGGPRKRG